MYEEIDVVAGNNGVAVTIPAIKYWTMLVLE
jgi:hypothetical protein